MMILILAVNLALLALVLWNTLAWPAPRPATGEPRPTCSVLIPARNEAANIGACLETVLAQGGAVKEIIVCDDHSADDTARIVREIAAEHPIVRLIRPGKLPPGWCGKNFACAALGAEAGGEWLLFLDADARLARDAVAAMVAEAGRRGISLLSCWPGLVLGGFWEKLLMPMLNFVVFTLFPAPLSLRRDDASLGLAHGACILVRRADYAAAGGHGLVRSELFEDTCLARAWRQGGRRGLCLDGQRLVRVRMYDSPQAIWRGFQKNFYPAFRRSASFWRFLGLHGSCFLAPFAFILAGRGGWAALAAASCVVAMRAVQALRFGYPLWSALLHPVAQGVMLAIGLGSWWRCRTGEGVEWKGRRYGPIKAGARTVISEDER